MSLPLIGGTLDFANGVTSARLMKQVAGLFLFIINVWHCCKYQETMLNSYLFAIRFENLHWI